MPIWILCKAIYVTKLEWLLNLVGIYGNNLREPQMTQVLSH